MKSLIDAKKISKSYGNKMILNTLSFSINEGQLIGLVGKNGAGKTTLIKALLGLTSYEGSLKVMGHDPSVNRAKLLEDVSFIADVATLPRWMKISDLLDYVAGVHISFDRARAVSFVKESSISLDKKIGELSKGMIVQVHLSIILAIESRILILDEPTLGLDILHRKKFYDSLLEHYYSKKNTIIITSHQVEEIEHFLTDVFFINDGEFILKSSMKDLYNSYCSLKVTNNDYADKAKSFHPLLARKLAEGYLFVFDKEKESKVKAYGSLVSVALSDLFVAKVGG